MTYFTIPISAKSEEELARQRKYVLERFGEVSPIENIEVDLG